MNAEAEREIARLILMEHYDHRPLHNALQLAMRFAYADAARIAEDNHDNKGEAIAKIIRDAAK